MGGVDAMAGVRVPFRRKAWRYSLVSVANTVVGEVVIAVTFGVLHWSARAAAVVATAVATGPAYLLNRRWVWGRGGASDPAREILPFWLLAFAGLVLSAWAADRADAMSRALTDSHPARTVMVMGATLASLGLLWLGRFLVLDHLVFGAGRQASHDRAERADVRR